MVPWIPPDNPKTSPSAVMSVVAGGNWQSGLWRDNSTLNSAWSQQKCSLPSSYGHSTPSLDFFLPHALVLLVQSLRIHKVQSQDQIWPAVSFCRLSFMEKQLCPFRLPPFKGRVKQLWQRSLSQKYGLLGPFTGSLLPFTLVFNDIHSIFSNLEIASRLRVKWDTITEQ